MDFSDAAIVLAVRRHGESDAILSALTATRGRHLGLVKGGHGRRLWPILQAGNRLIVDWRARLAEQLGHFRIEPTESRTAYLLDDPDRLAALASVCALLDLALPEREPLPDIYADTDDFLNALATGHAAWAAAYVRWEMRLIAALGFGLDLSQCAVTGDRRGLAYVSPRTGRAVTAAGAGDFVDRLLPLPSFLVDAASRPDRADILAGLRLTGHFLIAHIVAPRRVKGDVPARERLIERLSRPSMSPRLE